ncbi:MAG: hypothetical protein HRU25_03555 [Psychrobium sp.]|nr:hypothetical protein [Psychrobium sp.]
MKNIDLEIQRQELGPTMAKRQGPYPSVGEGAENPNGTCGPYPPAEQDGGYPGC